ncbi:MAG: NAD(P)H-quinone oxidoreductase subunit J, partial [Cyanobium sp.]
MPDDITPAPQAAGPAPTNAATAIATVEPGPLSLWLTAQGFGHDPLPPDHLGVEVIGVEPAFLPLLAAALKATGFDYLQCQGGYDEGPGGRLVSFYHLVKLAALADQCDASQHLPAGLKPEEVRLKVFLPRDGALSIPSLYGLFRGADWQERETFDMYGISFEGHPHPKRLLMPEDWKGF